MSRACLRTLFLTALCVPLIAVPARAGEDSQPLSAPAVPTDITGKDGVKAYLMVVAKQCRDASEDLKTHADAYAALVTKNGGDVTKTATTDGPAMAYLITAMRDDYRRLDSFGYEYVEGIVAGVPSLAAYDVELDAGLPVAGAGPDDTIAAVKIVAGPLVLDREGSLNNFLIEPTVFGTNERFSAGKVDLTELSDKPTLAPNPALVVALADYAVDGYGRLYASADAWRPTDKDCFAALAAMTPTLADYFEDWKESKLNGAATGGRFVAVSRVSDMRGIMASTRLIWQGLDAQVVPTDAALAQTVSQGYDRILSFIDTVETREKQGGLTAEQIDAMGSQAKEKADKLTAQVTEAAALLKIEVGLVQ